MTRKMTNKEIVGEAMYSVRRSLTANISLPPMNSDGSFKSVNRLVDERRYKEWQAKKADEALVIESDTRSTNDPEQLQWERQQGLNRKRVQRNEYELVIPDGVKAVFYIILFVVCVVFLAGYHISPFP